MSTSSSSPGVHIRLILTMIFWGGTFVAGRLLAEEISPLTAATLRFVTASAMLLAAIFIRDRALPRPNIKQLGTLLLLGLTGVFAYNIFFFTGLQSVEAGRASMIIATNPVITCLFAILFLGERSSLLRTIGMGISVCGALTVISRGDPGALFQGGLSGTGEFYMMGCVLSWSAYTLIGKQLLNKMAPLVAVAYSCTAGTLLLLGASLYQGQISDISNLSFVGASCIFYFALFGTTLGFMWFYDGVKKLGASRASMYVNLVPVSGILLGTIVLGEALESSLLIGGALVFLGLYLINYRRKVS